MARGFKLQVGKTYQLRPHVIDQNNATNAAPAQIKYISDAPTVATVSEKGLVTGVAEGLANISVSAEGLTAVIDVTVYKPKAMKLVI